MNDYDKVEEMNNYFVNIGIKFVKKFYYDFGVLFNQLLVFVNFGIVVFDQVVFFEV